MFTRSEVEVIAQKVCDGIEENVGFFYKEQEGQDDMKATIFDILWSILEGR